VLENDIRAVYRQMNTMNLPPSRISIPVATSRGARTRMRARRAGLVATPVLAAAAVLAVVAVVLVAEGSPSPHGRPAPSAPGPAGAAPVAFNVLRPYERLGGLAAGVHQGWINGTPDWQWVTIGGKPESADALVSFARGQCAVTRTELTCPQALGAIATPRIQSRGSRVGYVHGRPAYWYPHGFVSFESAKGIVSRSAGGGTHESGVTKIWDGVLTWQYARGGWAKLYARTPQAALPIARATRFGPAVAPTFRLGIQLTGMPASAHVNYLLAGPSERSDVELGISGGYPELGYHLGPNACTPDRDVAGKISTETINGYRVRVFRVDGQPPWSLCAPDARGLTVTIDGGSSDAAVTSLFRHVRVLGADPAGWTTKPIG
jgi:hypothetical protein